MGPPTDISGPLAPGVRVSLEFPQAGTCVGVVTSVEATSVALDLLDELPNGHLVSGLTIQLFMPRAEGLYHWLGALNGVPAVCGAMEPILPVRDPGIPVVPGSNN